jgi:hypothetical protein
MIISLEGPMGSGKTTAAVALATDDQKKTGRRIITNMHLNIPHTKFDIAFFLEQMAEGGGELEDCILIMDEFYQIADSRSSGSKLNRLWTYFIVQTRKLGVDMYVCTHYLDHIDIRNRRAVDIRGACRSREYKCQKCESTGSVGGVPCEKCLGYGKIGMIHVNFLDRRMRRRYPLDIMGNRYWHIFNTLERLPMQARVLQGIDTAMVGGS